MPAQKPKKPVQATAKTKTAAKADPAKAKPVAKPAPAKAKPVAKASPASAKTAKPVKKAAPVPAKKTAAKAVEAEKTTQTKTKAAAAEVEVKKTAKAKTAAEEEAPVKKAAAKKAPAAKTGAKRGPKKKGDAPADDDLGDIESDLEGEPAAAEPGEKVKPLRMKISKAKERALMKEFGLDETVLTEAEMKQRRERLKALIKLGKTRGYLTNGEISDHLPDKLVDAETLEVVIATLNDLGVAVYEQTPDAETLIITDNAPTGSTEE